MDGMPLTEEQIQSLMAMVKERFPAATDWATSGDFGCPRRPAEVGTEKRAGTWILGSWVDFLGLLLDLVFDLAVGAYPPKNDFGFVNGKAVALESLTARALLTRDMDNPQLVSLVKELTTVQNDLGSPGFAPVASTDTARADAHRQPLVQARWGTPAGGGKGA